MVSFDCQERLSNEYKEDLSRLKHHFELHCVKDGDRRVNNDRAHQMRCSTFVQWIADSVQGNHIEVALHLNGLFDQVRSSLIDQGLCRPHCQTMDFHGFLLCLQRTAGLFNMNLRHVIKNLISSTRKSHVH